MRMFFSWTLTLIAGLTTFVGLTMLMLLPLQASQNRDLLDQVKGAAAYQAKTGHLPTQFQYRGEYSGIGKMWVDRLDECDPSFVPPRSDRFVIGFWQGAWWHCYGYPSGRTNLQTTFPSYLASEAGPEIFINLLIAAAAFWSATRLRERNKKQRPMRFMAKAAWFAALMVVVNMEYYASDSTDDQFVESPGYVKWFVQVFDTTIGPIQEAALGFDWIFNLSVRIGNITKTGIGTAFMVLFIFWMLAACIVGQSFTLAMKYIRDIRRA